MKRTVTAGIISAAIGLVTFLILVLILTGVTLNYENPKSLSEIAGIIAVFGASAVCGAVSAIFCKRDILCGLFAAFALMLCMLLLSLVLSPFKSGISDGIFGSKLIVYAIIPVASVVTFFLFGSKPKRKNSAAKMRKSARERYVRTRI